MSIELKVPEVGESITEIEIGDWLKKEGDHVDKDEPLVTLESEKATVELPAPNAGTLGRILKQKGDLAHVGEVVGVLEDGDGAAPQAKPQPKAEAVPSAATPKPNPAKPPQPEEKPAPAPVSKPRLEQTPGGQPPQSPRMETLGGRPGLGATGETPVGRQEEVVPMSRLRRTLAERLVEGQHNAALLTTFNEIDMSEVIALRQQYGEPFQQKYSVKLGFMSFFVKAAIEGLKAFPVLNAEVRGASIVYHNYYDIGIAVGGGKGLVVPVLRNAERLSFAQIEKAIGDFAVRAKDNKLKVEELDGGTFTISNGGVYGSLLSTPIINPPQSGVLGLHAIQSRPIAHDNTVVIRPMMYVALTYDHRIVDGREAVSFLKRLKELVEKPARVLLEV